MSETHGNDYEYTIDGDTFFPVVWDIRGAWMNYFGYARDYIGYSELNAIMSADREISGVLTQALNAGVNTALIRGTLGHDAQFSTNYFPGRANMVRALGMNVILGGFKDIIDDPNYNIRVKNIIEAYVATPVPPGYAPIVGIHGFDEPDNKYDVSGQQIQGNIVNILTSYHSWSNNLGYPFGCFLAKPAQDVPSLNNPHTGIGSTIYQICSHLDFPMLDWYPCINYDEASEASVPQADIWGATDLMPTLAASNHYYAYNNRDELWSIDHNETTGNTSFIVYEVTDEEEYGEPGFSQVFSSQPGLSWPFEVASSDYRAADVGNRATAGHNLNSAVVMYHTADQIEQTEVVMHNGTSLTPVNPPNLNETASTILFCVGEENYESSDRVSTTTPVNSGVIGSADLRILWCGDGVSGGQLQKRVWILKKNSSGTGLTNAISTPLILPGNFMPTGAIWGYFWSDTFPYRQSGFILYNELGNYVVVYTKDHDTWKVSSSVQTDLFDGGINPGAVIAYRSTEWPVTSYSTACDYLCAIVNDPPPAIGSMYLHWCSGSGSTMQMNQNPAQFYVGQSTASDYNHLSFRHVWQSGDVRFFFGGDGVTSYRTNEFLSFPEGWADEHTPILSPAPDWGIVNNPMRVRHTRRAFANALMNKLNFDIMSIRAGELRLDNGINPVYPNFASTETYFNNMCSYGEDEYGAYDLEFNWGIDQTPGDNCLFANVQAFGKSPMSSASFCPPHDTGIGESDTLLYMAVAPIVHGARGLSFYALDMALMAGPAFNGGIVPMYRAPNTFLNWGPSRNCAENADLVDRVHDVVRTLTGNNGGPDFLGALVDHSNYTVLDENEAINAQYMGGGSWETYPNDDFLNFLALEDDQTGDILLLVSHDYDDFVGPTIYFPNKIASEYGTVQCWGGYDPDLALLSGNPAVSSSTSLRTGRDYMNCVVSNDPLGQIKLCVDFSSLPRHSVSLLYIPYGSKSEENECRVSEPLLGVSRTADGSVSLQLSEAACGFNLKVYDLLGRQISQIRLPEAETGNQNILLNRADFIAGLYFAVISSDTAILQTEKITFF